MGEKQAKYKRAPIKEDQVRLVASVENWPLAGYSRM
jgi:hypothetical protein